MIFCEILLIYRLTAFGRFLINEFFNKNLKITKGGFPMENESQNKLASVLYYRNSKAIGNK